MNSVTLASWVVVALVIIGLGIPILLVTVFAARARSSSEVPRKEHGERVSPRRGSSRGWLLAAPLFVALAALVLYPTLRVEERGPATLEVVAHTSEHRSDSHTSDWHTNDLQQASRLAASEPREPDRSSTAPSPAPRRLETFETFEAPTRRSTERELGLAESARVQVLALVLLAIVAVVLYAARGRPRLVVGLTTLAVAIAIPGWLFVARSESSQMHRQEARLRADRSRELAVIAEERSRTADSADSADSARPPSVDAGRSVRPLVIEETSSSSASGDEAEILTNDRERWTRTDGLVNDSGQRAWRGAHGDTPPWVLDAGGARPESRNLGSRRVEVWVPDAQRQLVGYSDATESEETAVREARHALAGKLAALALLDLDGSSARVEIESAWPLAVRLALDRLPELESGVYSELAERSYATVHRAAVLASVPEDEPAQLGAAISKELARGWIAEQEQLRSWLWIALSVILLGVAIFLLHTFVNAGTKGYFAWPLRLASGGLFVLLSIALYLAKTRLFF